MTTELPPEQMASYSAIIDDILSQSDLNLVSAKRIRKGLQEEVDYDITPQKEAINALIGLRFDKFQREHDTSEPAVAPEPAPTTNGAVHHPEPKSEEADEASSDSPSATSPAKRKASHDPSDDDDELSDVIDSPPPKKVKKVVKATKVKAETETDAQIAQRMQAELNATSGRSTRGGGAKKKTVVKKKAAATPSKKKKSKAKLNSDDDSELEGNGSGSDEKPERPKTGGFHKQMLLSEPLSALLGETSLSRPQTVKKIWEYVKERDLQDPKDKRYMRCDEAMRAVFKQEKVHMFTMNKLLAANLYPVDE